MLAWVGLALGAEHVLAVAPFQANTADAALAPMAAGLPDMLTTDLGEAADVTLVERARLDAVLAELKLQQSDWADPATVARVGKGVGASAMVVGSLSETGGVVRLDARLVDTETGTVRLSVEKQGPADQVFELERQLALAVLDALQVELTAAHRARLGQTGPRPGVVGQGFDPNGAPLTMVQSNGMFMPGGHLFVDGAWVQKIVKKTPLTVTLKPGVHEIGLATTDKAKVFPCFGVLDVPAGGLSLNTVQLCERLAPGTSPYGTASVGGMLRLDQPVDVGLSVQVDGMYENSSGYLNVGAGFHNVVVTYGKPGTMPKTEICRLAIHVPEGGVAMASVSSAGCSSSEGR